MRNVLVTLPFLSGLAVAVAFFLNWTAASDRQAPVFSLQRRTFNQTEQDACQAIVKAMTSSNSKVVYPLDITYAGLLSHYMSSSTQYSACVAVPSTPADISAAIKVIGSKRIRFAVKSAGHASNQGFSSTPGVHISLQNFQQVNLSGDKKTVDVGPGNIWDNVYSGLEGTGVAIVGGRVSGVGVGGFITGGGGYSWKTNQYGLTSDTLVSVDLVLPNGTLTTASATQNSDLFWAIKGGGNKFGIIHNFRLKTVPQGLVYGGLRTYTADQVDNIVNATFNFSENSKDSKAQILPTFNYVLGQPAVILLAFYDAPTPTTDAFAAFSKDQARAFTDDWKTRSILDLVKSAPSDLQAGQRGAFHTVSLQKYSKSLLNLIVSELKYYGSQAFLHSGTLISYDVEPFLPYSRYAQDAAWPHKTNALPLNLYFAWTNPLEDEFWTKAIKASANKITAQAKSEGQNLDDLYLYPNYAITGTPSEQLYGPNLGRLSQLKERYDPQDVMGLTTYFPF
ncbi:related to 6-hydroxy-D-nicotine oxidase [Melanopsichium pennsylvanicum]|uniref:Related to 6-hydroxy-D-nicotine oxidase n=2 Tax=Melanopsichium pennsylvanicum TaxID=63383 RepID=A0AAJ4XNK5_9BASI|nr:fad-binding domain-containing protein [Melanopsichium pennsylvanicum 4]SNX85507.1 related to 6-hydroxy-D-nicotine oxidase [Melanopsichium pennsylvanicum]